MFYHLVKIRRVKFRRLLRSVSRITADFASVNGLHCSSVGRYHGITGTTVEPRYFCHGTYVAHNRWCRPTLHCSGSIPEAQANLPEAKFSKLGRLLSQSVSYV